jgi:WYL_2, Sm-like SH3 beta-barrel fold
MMNKYELKEVLSNGVATVTFEKVDGTERTMKCTLLNEYLPPHTETTDESEPRKQNDNIIAVWDIEKNDWRSFRVDSVKSLIQE